MVGRNYTDLNLDRSAINGLARSFIDDNNFKLASLERLPGNGHGIRIIFIQAGQSPATVDLFYNKGGTTTIKWKMGKNQPLGELLADHLYDSINPEEFEQVNMVIEGMLRENIESVLEITAEQPQVAINIHNENVNTIVWKIVSQEFQDELTVSYHINSFKLQIQGRPLSCYRMFIFNLTSLLDLNGLEKVLIRKDESRAEIVQQDVAREWLKGTFGESYTLLHVAVEKLLVSGLCVKLASPKLPDYCMLLYPELRAIEGVLKEQLYKLGIDAERDFGGIFIKNNAKGSYEFDSSHSGKCEPKVENIISDAYGFYNKERHGLFHMETAVNASRLIGTLAILMSKSKLAWEHIEKLYSIK